MTRSMRVTVSVGAANRTRVAAAAVLVLASCSASGSSSIRSAPSVAPTTSKPAFAIPPTSPPISSFPKAFSSPVYGYTISLAADWTVQAATESADDPAATEDTVDDVVTVTGTDTTIDTLAMDLGGQPFGAWLEDYRASVTPHVPSGCDGGDVSTWPTVAVGDHEGRWEHKCNEISAFVENRGKVYVFTWANSTFTESEHMHEQDFKATLATVTFP
jgi:hypothetical protein